MRKRKLNQILKIAALFSSAILANCGVTSAGDWEDIFAPYLQRIDKATTSSGNAKNVNTAIHVIDPWPRHVRNRNIPADGARMVGVIKRYKTPSSVVGAAESTEAAPSESASTSGSGSGGSQSSSSGQSGQSSQ